MVRAYIVILYMFFLYYIEIFIYILFLKRRKVYKSLFVFERINRGEGSLKKFIFIFYLYEF